MFGQVITPWKVWLKIPLMVGLIRNEHLPANWRARLLSAVASLSFQESNWFHNRKKSSICWRSALGFLLRYCGKTKRHWNFGLANTDEQGVLRNADLKLYADVAARSGQTRLYLDVLQQWALEREGTLAAEAWGDIAIFLQKRFGNVDTALDAIKRAIDADPNDWLNWQFLCQIQEANQQWSDLQESLSHLEGLSSGPLAAQYAHRQALVALGRVGDAEQGLAKLRDALSYGPHLQATLDMLKVGVQLDDSETISVASNIWNRLDRSIGCCGHYICTFDTGAYGRIRFCSPSILVSLSRVFGFISLLESSDVEERKRVFRSDQRREG